GAVGPDTARGRPSHGAGHPRPPPRQQRREGESTRRHGRVLPQEGLNRFLQYTGDWLINDFSRGLMPTRITVFEPPLVALVRVSGPSCVSGPLITSPSSGSVPDRQL